MIGLVRTLALFTAAFLTICTAAFAAPPPTEPERQILVMVRHPPDHYRPNGAYGGSYGDALARSARQRLARGLARQYGLSIIEDYPMPMIGIDCFVMLVPEGRSPASIAQQISHDPKVSWAEPVGVYRTQSAPAAHSDPLYAAQPAANQWRLADLHRIATGRGVKIAVIDSGIDAGQPDLAGQLIVNRNFVTGREATAEQHGTAVAGIIAAKADNGVGIAGIAPGARLLGLRACWQPRSSSTVCDTLSLAKALYFAAGNGADVINLSLSGPDDRLLRELLKVAMGRGSVIVAAFDRTRRDGGFPASFPGVIPVSDGSLAGPGAHVYTAPGRDVPTTEPGGRWFLVSGSSFAAAHVSGLAALVRQFGRSPAITLVSQGGSSSVIDACATLVRAARHCDCSCAEFAGVGMQR